ncbi:serine/threonine-protein kinase [Streptomyces antimicrobicus]|uniref:non-specific serine/threonine protein kinase n=1 Tax=Streptomyces antimicrobicus TaxID=2883108 RepID=A0ABS8B3T1_9ACTN|nr:serine/threonine-protein kinase [Streptomyces antimicrobicus]MCB5179261.1 serine/threonine protein kinase [Streptomyces antimicrobicus]
MKAWTVPGYTETRELGSGGSGRVVLAVHDGTSIPVAVKYLSDRLRQDPAFVREFRAEARLLGALHSPYVVGLYEYVEAPDGAAIVMELVDGIALRAVLQQAGQTGPEAALVVLKGSLLGLAAAHRAGVVHRDYKPENVLVAADGTSKLVDFGIAADRGTTPGVAGTPAYMAPEQWQGQPASPAADVYAATATFFECLTGRKPFAGENFAELALQHIEAPVPEAEAPEPVRPLIRRGLAKRPEDRPENAEAFVAELEGLARSAYGEDWEERGQRKLAALAALLPLLFPSAAAPPASTTAFATTSLWNPGRRGWLGAGVALVLGALLVFTEASATDRTAPAGALSAFATTSAAPPTGRPGASASPTGTASPSASGSPSASASASASASTSASPSASGSGSPAPGPGTSPTAAPPVSPGPTTKPPTTPPPSPGVRVRSVGVTSFRQSDFTQAVVTLSVAADGPATVRLEWFSSNSPDTLGTSQGTMTFPSATAGTARTLGFSGRDCYWHVRATTTPAAGSGAAVSHLTTQRCQIR